MNRAKVVFLFLILSVFKAYCQQKKEGANWLFGGRGAFGGTNGTPGIHLDFNGANVQVAPFNFDFNSGIGVSSISDKKGNLLFFSSNGHVATRKIVNNKYEEMPNGDVFNSTANTFSELIAQSPVNEHIYYIFFNAQPYFSSIFDLYAAQIDMRLNNGYGDVVPNSLQLIRKNIGHNMTAMLHTNNRDTWVLTQNIVGDSMQTHLLSPNGISGPVFTHLNMYMENFTSIKSSPNSEMFVATRRGTRTTEIFSFNRNNGTVSSLYSLSMPTSYYIGQSYSFSPGNSKLYVGTNAPTNVRKAAIFQFDLASGNSQQIQQSATLLYYNPSMGLVSDLQLGIDGKIYVILPSTSSYLPRINYPDQPGMACGFKLSDVKVSARNNSDMFPSLNQTIYRNAGKFQVQATKDTICFGESVQLSAYGAGADHFKWKTANGLTAPSDTLANPVVSPTVTTRFFITGSSPYRSDTVSVKVVVLPKATVTINGPNQVIPQQNNIWYKAQNPQKLSITWDVSGGIISSTFNDSISVNWGNENSTAKVRAIAKSPFGCPGSSDSLSIIIAIPPQPVFYNIITPNNDLRNDAFVIDNLKWYTDNELVIYNRWGVEVYRKRNYENNWQAEKLTSGIYYYRFQTNGQSWKGWVDVVK